jgi:hypothetical protein
VGLIDSPKVDRLAAARLPTARELTDRDMATLRDMRADDPGAVIRLAASRSRRTLRSDDGKLLLVAADHTARGVVAVRDDPLAMIDRLEMLRRLVLALSHPGVDGVLATADILEDLLLLGALENKIVIGSMNRGGLRESIFEIDDRFTGCNASVLGEMGFDGGKMLTRIDLTDPFTVAMLEATGRAVGELAARGLMAMVEPFISTRMNGTMQNDLSPTSVARAVMIGSALGPTSRHTWLKLPVIDELASVMRSTTLPTLLLGGDPSSAPDTVYAKWEVALTVPGIRGLVVGRALLYPANGDVMASVNRVAQLVHPGS